MAIREIPKAYVYVCDGCGTEHKQENASGHYSNSRPKHWSNLKLQRDAYNYQGAVCADGSVERLLCEKCTARIAEAINSALLPDGAPNAT